MKHIGFIGMGCMARAIARGFIDNGAVLAGDISAYAPHYDRLKAFADEVGLHACRTLDELLARADTIIIAVKPHIVEEVLRQAGDRLCGKALLSVAAGWPFERYRALLGENARIQTIMPNTPCEVGAGMLLFEEAHSLTAQEREQAISMFCAVGEVEILPAALMTPAMAISGCGPAFAAMVIEALADAGVKYGLPRATAYRLASQTLVGTGRLQMESGRHPGAIKDAVCSPGGTTIRGVEALEKSGLRSAMMAAVQAVVEK